MAIDMSEKFPKSLADEFVRAADVVITVGCPIYPGNGTRTGRPRPAGTSVPGGAEPVRSITLAGANRAPAISQDPLGAA